MNVRTPALTAAVAAALLVGCAATRDSARALVLVEAEKDLMCPQDEIGVERQLGGKYVAVGCGRRATYDSVCQDVRCQVTREGQQAPGWRGRPDPGSRFDR